jgi:hypothetical protein
MKLRLIFERILFIIFILIILSIGGSILRNGWTNTWNMLFIPTRSPIFADMRTVQGSLQSEELGFDPQVKNPGDPWYRSMNYPKIWIWIAKLIQLNNETNYVVFICAYILLYLICCFFILRISPSLYVLLAVFSGASLLAVERGNNDLLAFVILFMGIYLSQNYFRAFSILLATILKVYPVLLVFIFIKKTKVFILLVLMIVVYFSITAGELKIIIEGNTALTDPASLFATYGLATTYQNTTQLLHLIVRQPESTYEIYKYIPIIGSLLLIITLSRIKIIVNNSRPTIITDLFVAGAIIFSGTYIITSNWDYRLIFLLFCIPYLLNIQNRFVKHSILISILISSNSMFVSSNQIFELIGQFGISLCIMSKYYTFIMITSLLIKESKQYLPICSLDLLKTYMERLKSGILRKGNEG